MIYLLISVLLCFQDPIALNEKGSIDLTINQLESNQGLVRVLVFSSAKGFPEDRGEAVRSLSIPIKHGQARAQIEELPRGKYAISAFHDEDEDGKIKKNLVGFPQEKYGFSKNPGNKYSIPKFDRCAVSIAPNQVKKVEIKLR